MGDFRGDIPEVRAMGSINRKPFVEEMLKLNLNEQKLAG